MSDDCFFNPAACEEPAAEAPAADGMMEEDHDAEEWAEVEGWMESNKDALMEANIAMWWAVAAPGVTALLELFVYKW